MRTVDVSESALNGADPDEVEFSSIVLISGSLKGLESPKSDFGRSTSRPMAEDTEPDKKADASGAVDEKNKEALENDGLGVNAQDEPVADGERAHPC
jgi:hypothetical protein